jgi:hypothetical protein
LSMPAQAGSAATAGSASQTTLTDFNNPTTRV